MAKSGAEGLICIGGEQGLGIAIGTDSLLRAPPRHHRLRQLNVVPQLVTEEILKLHDPTLYNHNAHIVGEIRPSFTLTGDTGTSANDRYMEQTRWAERCLANMRETVSLLAERAPPPLLKWPSSPLAV